MITAAEKFFIVQIKKGCDLNGDALYKDEEKFLKIVVYKLALQDTFTSQNARLLNDKCVKALKKAYSADFAESGKSVVAKWARQNEKLYSSSDKVVSGIVQNWYLKHGINQETDTVGCFSSLLVTISALAACFYSMVLLFFKLRH